MKNILAILLFVIPSTGFAQKGYHKYINDKEIVPQSVKKSIKLLESNKTPKASILYKQTSREKCNINIPVKANHKRVHDFYDRLKKSTLIINTLYKEKNGYISHNAASGFIISENGICVTNNHIFEEFTQKIVPIIAWTVTDYQGNVYAIEEVLASDKVADVAIFKINPNKKLTPFKINTEYKEGDEIFVMGCPGRRFYSLTKGIINRKFIDHAKNTERIAIDADFGGGSSGGPLLDEFANVIGVVVSTSSIASCDGKYKQMIIKECVPIENVLKLFKN